MKRRYIILTALATAITMPVVAIAQKEDTLTLLSLFGEVFERIRTDYVEETKDSDLVEAAINGMLTSLDPHSGYMNDKAFKEMRVQTKGEFGGLGIEVTMDNGLVKVMSPIDDTPAAKAGLQPGDYISHIDDEPVMGLTLSEAVEKMRGKAGTKIKLTILRENATEPMEKELVRAVITIRAARARVEGEDIAYIRLTTFNDQTTELMRSEFDVIKKDIKQLRGVVLDLRNNPGGLLEQAISVSDAFLTKGEVVSTRERDPNNTRRYAAEAGNEIIPEDVPVVVIINNGSASASEIVAGALQDHKRAVVLGTKSFGKGSVQTVIPLEGHGAIRLTTARYYTPSGNSIQAKGITPDITVEPAKIELLENDKLLRESDLRRRLQRIDEKKKAEDSVQDKEKPAVPDDKKDVKPEEKNQKESKDNKSDPLKPLDDYQLQRAIDLLRALSVYKQAAVAQ